MVGSYDATLTSVSDKGRSFANSHTCRQSFSASGEMVREGRFFFHPEDSYDPFFSNTFTNTHTQTGSIPLHLKIVLICLPFLLPTARSGDNGGCKRAKPPCTLSDAGPQVHLQVLETPNTPIPAGTLFHIHNTQHFQLPFLGDALDGLLPLGILATNNNISWSTPLPAQTLFISIFMHFNLNILPPLSGHHTGRTGGPGEAGKKIESRQLKGHHLPKTPTP